MSLMLILVFCFGAILGSFLNVVSLRFNTGRSFVSGRSACFSCGKQIHWYENIPFLSFIFLRGKCSGCKSRISLQYPLVEFFTAILFVLGFIKFQSLLAVSVYLFGFSYVLYLLIIALLVLIFLYDLKHKIIPNEFVYPLIVCGAIVLFFKEGYFMLPQTLDLLAGPLLFLPFFVLWAVSGGCWIGFADGKLAWGIGWILGLVVGVSAVVLAFWLGAAYALGLFAMLKVGLLRDAEGLTMKSEVPFGPFLIMALLIAYFMPIDFFYLGILLPS